MQSIGWLVDLVLSKVSGQHQVADDLILSKVSGQCQLADGSDTLQGEWTASGGW